MKNLALVIAASAAFGCGMRTELHSSADASATSGPRNPDTPPDGPALPDLPPDRPSDPPRPDLPPDRPSDPPRPDLPPDRPSDPPRPDLPPDRPSDPPRPDLPPDRPSDPPRPDLPPDRAPDRPLDLRPDYLPDLPRDVTPVFPPDLPPDRARERAADLATDLLPPGDAQCAPGSNLPCACDNGLLGTRICLPSLVYSECGCGTEDLMRVKNGLIGTWTGTATTPFRPTYKVTFTFDSYTHYSARALDGDGVPALYYGTDNESPLKRYDITDIQANGDATGTIDICFEDGGCSRNRLQAIQLSADLSQLKFYIMYLDQYGPLEYDLQRTGP